MIKKVKFRSVEYRPGKWKMEASSNLECSSASPWMVLAEGKMTKNPCPDEIQVFTIPGEMVGAFFCYRMRFYGGKLPTDLQTRKKNLSGKLMTPRSSLSRPQEVFRFSKW